MRLDDIFLVETEMQNLMDSSKSQRINHKGSIEKPEIFDPLKFWKNLCAKVSLSQGFLIL